MEDIKNALIGKTIIRAIFEEKIVKLVLSNDTELIIEVELPTNCIMAAYVSEVKRYKLPL
jgi:hypothetical protein